jgi:hypothetical protein
MTAVRGRGRVIQVTVLVSARARRPGPAGFIAGRRTQVTVSPWPGAAAAGRVGRVGRFRIGRLVTRPGPSSATVRHAVTRNAGELCHDSEVSPTRNETIICNDPCRDSGCFPATALPLGKDSRVDMPPGLCRRSALSAAQQRLPFNASHFVLRP